MPSVLPDTGIANSAILPPVPMPRATAPRDGGDAPFAAMLDSPEPAKPAPREARPASRDRSGPAKPAAARPHERPDAEPTGPRSRPDTAAADTRARGATSEATAKTPEADRETKPETPAEITAKPAGDIAADAAPVAPADVPAEPTPAATPVLAVVDGEAETADAPKQPATAEPGVTPLPAAETPAAEAKPATDAKPQIVAAPASAGGPTPDAEAAAKPAVADALDKPGLIPIEIKGDAEESAKPEAEAVKQARPAAEEIKAPQPERTARPFEPFAAVRAAAEAMQSLTGTTSVQPVPTTGIPAIHAAAASAAPTATAAASQPQPVPMAGVAIEIATQALAGKNRFEIRLDPPELGRIDVRLDVDKDGNVTSKLIVERAETLDLLRRDAQQLERALQQAGLKTSDSALQFSLRDQGAERDGEQPSQRGGRNVDSDDAPPAVEANRYRATLRAGGLDISI